MVVKLHTPAFLCRKVNGVAAGACRWDTRVSERLEYQLARRARLLTSPSRALADDVAAEWRLAPSNIQVIPNPIDDALFTPDGSEETDAATVLYVGRLERRKGVETLIDAWAGVLRAAPRARLRLVGKDHPSGPDGGSMKTHLQKRLAAGGVSAKSVEFVGGVDRSELPAIYRSATVCVIPSLYENFPYTCLEAMACGCAVVGSRVGGIPEMVTDQTNGLVVPPRDADALAAAIVRVLTDQALRQSLGQQARDMVCRQFSRDVICRRTADVYAGLVEQKRTGHGGRA
jgi:glycosyltransferase involved in cell wall biosynthesis